jgi:hypothetical protein
MEPSAFWDGNVAETLFLVFSNVALVPAIILLSRIGDPISAYLLIFTLVSSSLYHMCRAGALCLFDYGHHRLLDYISVYLSITWILTRLATQGNFQLHVFAFIIAFTLTLFAAVAGMNFAWLSVLGIGLPSVIAITHALIARKRLFYNTPWAVATFVLAIIGGAMIFFAPKDWYGWAHSLWHVFVMLSVYTFIIATTPVKREKRSARIQM